MRLGRRLLGPLGARFALAFVAVSLFSVAVFSTAVLIADQSNVTHLAATQRDRVTAEAAALAANAYSRAGGWAGADLSPVSAFATAAGITVAVRDAAGSTVMAEPPGAATAPDRLQEPVTVDGSQVGVITTGFPGGAVNPDDRHLRSSLFAAVGWSAGLAILAALVVSVFVVRGVTRPVRRLAGAVRSLELGESSPRVGPAAGPGELGELGRAFDSMAASLEEEDRLRRALVADVAHELRTPIAVMQAETEALIDGVTPTSPEALTSLHEESVRLGRLVEDLQTMASAQAAGLELISRPLDLGRVVADAAGSLSPMFRDRRIDVELDLPPTGMNGDPHRLRQVALNLLTNAAKFTPAGGSVVVRTFGEDGRAVLEVTDSGPGVADEDRDAIWERFYRGRTGRSSGGSGIGLAVAKELVRAHGGTIGVENRPGGGARFTARFPSTDRAPSSPPVPDTSAHHLHSDPTGR